MLWQKIILWMWAEHEHWEYVPNIDIEMLGRMNDTN